MLIPLFTWNEFKLPKVTYRKLGKHRAWGYYHKDKIHIDERLKGKEHLEILLHEATHCFLPELSENEVRKFSRQLTDLLWEQKVRKIDE